MRKTSVIVLALAAACVCLAGGCAGSGDRRRGDIACAGDPVTDVTCHQQATSDLLVSAPLAAVLPLEDIQPQHLAVEHQRRVPPDLGAREVDQPADSRQS